MASWMTGEQIAQLYRVGEARLLSYARRGNLPARVGEDGVRVYDADRVASYFARRDATEQGLGILGTVCIGPRDAAAGQRRASRVKRTDRRLHELAPDERATGSDR